MGPKKATVRDATSRGSVEDNRGSSTAIHQEAANKIRVILRGEPCHDGLSGGPIERLNSVGTRSPAREDEAWVRVVILNKVSGEEPVARSYKTTNIHQSVVEKLVRHSVPSGEFTGWDRYVSTPTLEDAIVTVNSFFRYGTHKEGDLRWINALVVDCDCRDLPWTERSEAICRLVEGGMPRPTYIVDSGRGVWLLFQLAERLRGTADNIRWAKLQQKALREYTRTHALELSPDDSASDLARCIRLPGSINSKSQTSVRWFNTGRRVSTASVDNFLGEVDSDELFDPSTDRRVPNRREGLEEMLRRRLRDLNKLFIAGEIRKGCRSVAILTLCETLVLLTGQTTKGLRELVDNRAQMCVPPLDLAEANSILDSVLVRNNSAQGRKPRKWKNVTLAKRLGVTVVIAHRLELESIRPDWVPPKHTQRAGRKAENLSLIAEIDPYSEMTYTELAEVTGVSRKTISLWLREHDVRNLRRLRSTEVDRAAIATSKPENRLAPLAPRPPPICKETTHRSIRPEKPSD